LGILSGFRNWRLFFDAQTSDLFTAYSFLLCSCALPIISELNDPHVGPAIISEAGETFVTQSYFAIIAGILLPLCGLLAWFLKSEKK
jgi:hypothetical protein